MIPPTPSTDKPLLISGGFSAVTHLALALSTLPDVQVEVFHGTDPDLPCEIVITEAGQ